MKKIVDKRRNRWYISQALERAAQVSLRAGQIRLKKFKKIWKKFLTNGNLCGIVNKLSPRGDGEENVPWKLNNVRKAYAK